jgi:autocrine motility factor receptor
MQTLFFVRLTSSETRKVLEHIINYVIYKVIIPPSLFILCASSIELFSCFYYSQLMLTNLTCLNSSPLDKFMSDKTIL